MASASPQARAAGASFAEFGSPPPRRPGGPGSPSDSASSTNVNSFERWEDPSITLRCRDLVKLDAMQALAKSLVDEAGINANEIDVEGGGPDWEIVPHSL